MRKVSRHKFTGYGHRVCKTAGVAIADPRVSPCIAGPTSCSEWSLDLEHVSHQLSMLMFTTLHVLLSAIY